MASQASTPATVETLANAPESANNWTNPANAAIDDATEAQITAATYDNGDISYLLLPFSFGFAIPAGATIDGIVVEIDRRCFAGSAVDNRVQLAKGTAFANLVGTNKASATAWPTTSTIATYGSPTDLWGATWTPAEVNDNAISTAFAVFLSVKATANNTDVGVDFIRATVYYTEASSGPVTVTPGVASLVLTPLVPSVLLPVLATPGVAALSTAAFAPTVSVSDNRTVTPGVASLATSALAPTVTVTEHQTVVPGLATLGLTTFAPTVTGGSGVTVVPGLAALSLSAFAPAVTASDHKVATPGVASLATSAFAPTVTATAHATATPGVTALSLTSLVPTVTVTNHQVVVPGIGTLILATFAPEIGTIATVAGSASASILVTATATASVGDIAAVVGAPTPTATADVSATATATSSVT